MDITQVLVELRRARQQGNGRMTLPIDSHNAAKGVIRSYEVVNRF